MSEARTRRGRSGKPVLEVHDLSKSYGERLALRKVSFEAAKGELLAVVGPNGAGKTTLLAILAGINPPDSGRISVADGEVGWVRNARAAGAVTLTRGLRVETVAIRELGPVEAAPVLKRYITRGPITRPFFDVTPESDLGRSRPKPRATRSSTWCRAHADASRVI